MRRLIWLVFVPVLLFSAQALYAQGERPFLQLNFDRQNNFTFTTTLDSWYTLKKGKYSLDARVRHSNIYNTAQQVDPFVQLYLRTSIWQYYELNPKLEVASWVETDQYFDTRNEKVNFYGGVRFKPHPSISITPLVGYSIDVRTAILGRTNPFLKIDHGFSPALLVESEHLWKEEQLAVSTQLFARYKFIDPRQQRNLTFRQTWAKKFEEGVQLQFGVNAGSHELDDYQSNSVKRIISDSINPQLRLGYTFFPGFEWRSENEVLINRRSFRFKNVLGGGPEENDLIFDGLTLSTSQNLSLVKGPWRATGEYAYLFASRKYLLENDLELNEPDFLVRIDQEKQKDFITNMHKTNLTLRRDLRGAQSLNFRLVSQYLQYDSPSEANYDDRDELSYLGSAGWDRRWSRALSTNLSISGNYRHYAFLFSEKSQDNYKQRSLRLDFRFAWDINPFLRIEGDNGIFVTYNVKDFIDFNKTDRATRNLQTNFKGIYRPTSRWRSTIDVQRKEIHQSYLNWEQFSETTLDTLRLLTIEQRNRYTFGKDNQKSRLLLEVGLKHFGQTKKFKAPMVGEDNILKTISLRQVTRQTGPLFSLGFRNRNQSSIDLDVWLQFQVRKNRFRELEGITVIGAAFYEGDLKNTTLEIRPYPNIKINYFFN